MNPLPDPVRRGVEHALADAAGRPVGVRSVQPVGGGCINPSARVDADDGAAYFVKWNADAPHGMFDAEADGLAALRAEGVAAGIRVPEVMGVGSGDASGPSWLLLEYVARGRGGADFAEALGRGLAAMHRPAAGAFGWRRGNFIGSLAQANPPLATWADFWRNARLAPQVERARPHLAAGSAALLERVLDGVEDATAGVGADGPSLLHGDLWSGNVYPGPGGEPVLIDPAVYRGHSEVDLAMSELFGGFPAGFLDSYGEVRPISSEYRRVRRPLYQLYYLLVHVNLFGAGYVAGAVDAARRVLAAL